MFLKSILESISLLTNPSILFLIFFWLFLQMIYHLFIRWATSTQESRDAAAPGCLTLILGFLWNGVWLGAILLFAFPILFKLATGLSWQLVEPSALFALRSGLLGVLAMSILSYLPFLGKRIAASPGLETLGAGLIASRLLIPSWLEKFRPFLSRIPYPSWLEILGIFLIFMTFSQLTLISLHLISKKLNQQRKGDTPQIILGDLGIILDNIWGIFLVFSFSYLVANRLT